MSERTDLTPLWTILLEKGLALGLAIATTYLQNRGSKVTPDSIAAEAKGYIVENNDALRAAEDKYIKIGTMVNLTPPDGGGGSDSD